MIPVKDTLVDIDTLPGEEIEFGIGDPRWVMKTQADLYSDITTAIIREYSTNAYDAHVMAGNPDPIRVTLPSMMDPFFVVEDKGVGMDMDIFRKIYTQFGVSDKRESNTTNGMLGYGSKSGVAYTTQFEVTTVKDGVKIHGVIKRKPDWAIVLKVVSTTKTDEPNGTKIRIPVHNVDEFIHKANEFYKFWLPGRVLVNGREPQHNVGEKITEGLYYSTQWNQSYIVMGNVAYRIANPDALFRNTKMNRINFVAYVDTVGEGKDAQAAVEFTPSREDLKYTDHTKATLQQVINDFEAQIIKTAKKEIDNAADHAEAFLAWKKWTDTLGRNMFADLEFKGDKFVSDFPFHGQRYQPSASYNAAYSIRQWGVEAMPKTMVVTDFEINLSSTVKQKAKQYAKMKDWPSTYILFTDRSADEINSVWIKKDHFVKWDDLKAALPKAPPKQRVYASGPKRIKGTFDFITAGGMQYEKPLPDDQTNLFYITVQDEKNTNVKVILGLLGLDATVVILSANRLNKFNRENPEVKEFTEFAKSKVILDGPSLLSDEAKRVRGIEWTTREWVKYLDMSKVEDENLHKIAALIKNEKSLTEAYESNRTLASYVGMRYNVKEHSVSHSDSIFDKYPLLSQLTYYRPHAHIYTYLNAVHSAEKENN